MPTTMFTHNYKNTIVKSGAYFLVRTIHHYLNRKCIDSPVSTDWDRLLRFQTPSLRHNELCYRDSYLCPKNRTGWQTPLACGEWRMGQESDRLQAGEQNSSRIETKWLDFCETFRGEWKWKPRKKQWTLEDGGNWPEIMIEMPFITVGSGQLNNDCVDWPGAILLFLLD